MSMVSCCMHYSLKPDGIDSLNSSDADGRPSDSITHPLQQRYQIIAQIGQGGFGRTFLATDTAQPVQTNCVIKQLYRHEGNTSHREAEIAQFHQEVLQLAELGGHSQIPQLLDAFELDEQFYLVEEWVDGQTLEQELAEFGAFDEDGIRQLLHELLPVLQYIHDRRVIHRDIKPANIIRRHCDGTLVLVDFGAAKQVGSPNQLHTETLIGSAEYTAPEQTRGKAVFASDLYSLGVTCIHLLTQLSPFDLIDSSENVWIWRDYVTQPISPPLAKILDRLLASAIKRRYSSAAAVLDDLCLLSVNNNAPNDPLLPYPSVSAVLQPGVIQQWLPPDYAATVFEPDTQRWHYFSAPDQASTGERSTPGKSHRFPHRRDRSPEAMVSHLESATASNIELGWRIFTVLLFSATSIVASLTVMLAIEPYLVSKSSTMSGQTALPASINLEHK